MMTITCMIIQRRNIPQKHRSFVLTEGIKWMINPGRGDFPVGQFDAQKRLPKGRGTPSFASSACPSVVEKRLKVREEINLDLLVRQRTSIDGLSAYPQRL